MIIDTLIGLILALSITSPAQAAKAVPANSLPASPEVTTPKPPTKRSAESLGVETTSRSVFVADVATGEVLYAKKPHDVLPIASLTKLMTAMVLLDSGLSLDERITYEEEDFRRDEGKDVFAPGESMTRREALHALLVGSVNASGNMLARTTMGREAFIAAMNAKAKELRLASLTFADPTGIDLGNRGSAADVAALMSTALSYPEIRAAAALPAVTIDGGSGEEHLIKTTNLLLPTYLNKDPYRIVGAKTGSLPQAGYNMAQVTRNADGDEIVVVGLGNPNHFSRYQDIKAVTTWAFRTFAWE